MALATWSDIKKTYPSDFVDNMKVATLRSASVLSESYQDTAHVDVSGFDELIFLFKYTQASLTSIEWKVLGSDNGTDWYNAPSESVAAGTTTIRSQHYTYPDSDDFEYAVVVKNRYAKLQVKGTGTITSSSLAVKVIGRR